MGIDAGIVLEMSPPRTGGSVRAEDALVGVHRAHADSVPVGAFA